MAGVLGCGRPESAADQKLSALQDEIHKVQSDHDRRLAALEVDVSESKKAHATDPLPVGADEAAEGSGRATSSARVVRLRPETTSGETAGAMGGTDDATPRPSIRVAGAGGAKRGRAEQIEQTIPEDPVAGAPPPRSAPRPSALDPEAKRAYDAALALVQSRQYDKGLEAFAGFLVRWPDHPHSDNALYWRGECYFAQGDYSRAAEQFDGTVSRFPTGNKAPDALLKLGICQKKLGLSAKAKVTFERLAREFPRSEAARRIPREETP